MSRGYKKWDVCGKLSWPFKRRLQVLAVQVEDWKRGQEEAGCVPYRLCPAWAQRVSARSYWTVPGCW